MPACPNGAVMIQNAPVLVYVTMADWVRWVGADMAAKLYPWIVDIGTLAVDVPAMVAANPDIPADISDPEAVIASSNPVQWYMFRSRLIEYAQYEVFRDNAVCMGVVGGPCTVRDLTLPVADPGGAASWLGSGSRYLNPPVLNTAIPAGQHNLTLRIYGPISAHVQWEIYATGLAEGIWYGDWLPGQTDLATSRDLPVAATQFVLVLRPNNLSWPIVASLPVKLEFKNAAGEAACSPATTAVTPAPVPSLTVPDYPTATCSTVADLCTEISAIKAAIVPMKSMIDLIQRQAVPFAYVIGASHTLSGQGEFAIQGVVGLSLSIASLPSGASALGAHPIRRLDLGYIAYGTSDGWVDQVPLRFDTDIVYPIPAFCTRVGYALSSGVIVTATELVREP